MTDAILEPAVLQQFRVFNVLGRSFSLLFRNIVPFGLLALGVAVLSAVFNIQLLNGAFVSLSSTATTIIGFIISGLLYYAVMAALVYGTFQDLRGQRASVGACLSRGLRLILPIFGVVVVSIVVISAASIALVIPGIIVITMLWVVIPVAVVERPGVFASLKRSAALTKGNRWRIFGMGVVLYLVILAVQIAIIPLLLNGNPLVLLSADAQELAAYTTRTTLVGIIPGAFFMAFVSVLVAVSYHDLRMIKDGIGTDEITAVFG